MSYKQFEMDTVSVKELIVSTLARRGNGKQTPIRVVTEIFTKDGEKIAEHDPCANEEVFALFDLIHFARWVLSNGIVNPNAITPSDVEKWLLELKTSNAPIE
jgi:hypothetical protein